MLLIFHLLAFMGVLFLFTIILPALLTSGDMVSLIVGTITGLILIGYIVYEWWILLKEDPK